MIDHDDLHAFVDGELSPEQEHALRTSLEGSTGSAKEVQAIRDLKQLLSQRVPSPETSEPWKACIKRLDEIDKTKRIERLVGRAAPAFCGGLFVLILLVGQFGHPSDKGNVSVLDMTKMMGSFVPVHPKKTDLGFDGAHWLDSLIQQSKLSTPDHLTIFGASSGEINGIPVKSFSARDSKGDLRILVIREPLSLEGMQPMVGHEDLRSGMMDGVNCVVKTHGSTTILIMAERTPEELASVAAEVSER